jgi:23S rRNA (cytidine1920-2'-O)/16S rRNA (cytidine1409-2'-O)-methyltransferase
LVRRGLATSRSQAAELIAAGSVLVSGSVADKSSRLVAAEEPVVVEGPPARFVSRGGEKLDAALARFDVAVTGALALDAGASTGGFTDCLLQRGAASVVAVDVGYAQLHERLRRDPRVVVVERTHILDFQPELTGGSGFDVVVADLSFISLTRVAATLAGLVGKRGELIVLVKPQFEAGRQEAARGRGVVRDPAVWRRVLEEVVDAFSEAGAAMMGVMPSPIRGADGNVEFLVRLRPQAASGAPVARDGTSRSHIDAALSEALETTAAV